MLARWPHSCPQTRPSRPVATSATQITNYGCRTSRKNPATGTYLPLSDNQKACNRAHAKLRAPGERANAALKSWRALTRVRMSPERITDLVHAVTALIIAGH